MKKNLQAPFSIATDITYVDANDPLWKRITINGIERLSGKRQLQNLYEIARSTPIPIHQFWKLALDLLDIQLNFDGEKLDAVPKGGALSHYF